MLKLITQTRKINLVICTYGGTNRWNELLLTEKSNVPVKDWGACSYLEKQIKSLTKYKHHLGQITFVQNLCTNYQEGYEEILRSIPPNLANTKVEILKRDTNEGASFGAFSYVAEIYKDKFDFYYFLEDDGIFVRDNFDSILLEQMDENANMLVTYRDKGLFCSSALVKTEAIARLNWKIPYNYSDLKNRKINIPHANKVFSKFKVNQTSFLAPFHICSLKYPYGTCPYFGHSEKYQTKMIFHFPGKGNEYLLVPAQMVDMETCTSIEPKFRLDGYF